MSSHSAQRRKHLDLSLWASSASLRASSAAGAEAGFYDSSWELRRGLDVAEVCDLDALPAEWRDSLAREPAQAPKPRRIA